MRACQTDKYKNSAHAQERHLIKPLTAQEILIAMGNSLDDYRTGVALYYEIRKWKKENVPKKKMVCSGFAVLQGSIFTCNFRKA